MNRVLVGMISSAAALVGILVVLDHDRSTRSSAGPSENYAPPVTVFCAASNKAVMEAVRADYEQETGRSINVMYGASQVLLSSLEVSRTGDLYLPADDSYLDIARRKGLINQSLPIATMRGVVAVRKGNPRRITAFSDLLRDDVRVVQANPTTAAVGRLTRETLQKRNLWNQLQPVTRAQRVTVTEVANDILVDAADAGIVYDAVLHTYPELEAIELPELQEAVSRVAIGLMSDSTQPLQAQHFARYISGRHHGQKRYAEFGFQTHGPSP